jgi:hypothetical protein
MFAVLTYTSDFIVYFVRALRDALSKKKRMMDIELEEIWEETVIA